MKRMTLLFLLSGFTVFCTDNIPVSYFYPGRDTLIEPGKKNPGEINA